ncbi:hypothetical protein AAC387_Pa02g3329 [Persea americana]
MRRSFTSFSDMESNTSTTLFPSHHCKTLHLVGNLRKHVRECGLTQRIDLVIVSPLLRLWTRKEKEIAIVTHSGFLFHTLKGFGNDCHPSVKQEIGKQRKKEKKKEMKSYRRCMLALSMDIIFLTG